MQDSASTPADTSAEFEANDLIHFDSITNAAFKQWKKLSRKFQKMVATCLKEGKHSYLCTVVMGQAHLDVKHFRVSQSVRVSYMPHNGKNCVVHIGVHSEFDKFSCNFTGISTNQKILTLQETIFMPNGKQNNSSSKPVKPTRQTNNVGKQTENPQKQPVGWGLFKQAVTSVLDDQVNQTLITYEGNFERVGAKVERLSTDVKANAGKLDSVESTQNALENRFKKSEATLNELKADNETTASAINRLDTYDKQRNESIHKLQNEASRLDGLLTTTKESVLSTGVKLNGLKNELNQASSRHTSAQEKLASDHATLVSKHESLVQESADLQKQIDVLTVGGQALRTEANDLASALSAATIRVTGLELKAKEQQDQLASQSADFQNAVGEFESQISSLKAQHAAEINGLQQSLEHASQRLETMDARLHELQQQQAAEQAARNAPFLQRLRRWFRGDDPANTANGSE